MFLDGIVKYFAACRQVAKVLHRPAQGHVVIAVPGYEVERRLQRVKQLSQERVLVLLAMLDSVASEDNGIRSLGIDVGDGTTQAIGTQRRARMIRRRRQDVRVANLRDQHARLLIDDVMDGCLLEGSFAGLPVVPGQREAMPVVIIELHVVAAIFLQYVVNRACRDRVPTLTSLPGTGPKSGIFDFANI